MNEFERKLDESIDYSNPEIIESGNFKIVIHPIKPDSFLARAWGFIEIRLPKYPSFFSRESNNLGGTIIVFIPVPPNVIDFLDSFARKYLGISVGILWFPRYLFNSRESAFLPNGEKNPDCHSPFSVENYVRSIWYLGAVPCFFKWLADEFFSFLDSLE